LLAVQGSRNLAEIALAAAFAFASVAVERVSVVAAVELEGTAKRREELPMSRRSLGGLREDCSVEVAAVAGIEHIVHCILAVVDRSHYCTAAVVVGTVDIVAVGIDSLVVDLATP